MGLIRIEEAWERMAALVAPLPATTVPLGEAVGSVLAETVVSGLDLPPFDNSAMDGYALRSADTEAATEETLLRIPVEGEVAAGGFRREPLAPGTSTRIMTGAPMPPGADSVLQLEHGLYRDGFVEVRAAVPNGRHVRRRGEDVREGQVLFEPGVRLHAQQIGLLAGAGVGRVAVRRAPEVSVLVTGSELVPPGEQLLPGQIHDSNGLVLRSLLESDGCRTRDLGMAGDNPGEIEDALRSGLDSDVLIVSGGVSVGAHDHVKDVLRGLGMEKLFWRVNMKPGKPILCGRIGHTWVFGLPGNPISCVIGYLIFIEPLLRRLAGEAGATPRFVQARLGRSVRKRDGRRTFLTGKLAYSGDGEAEVTPTMQQGSAMTQALAQANSFIVLPEEATSIEASSDVQVLRFPGAAGD